jgi:glycosyltransferase involved in cell wall biosynthesis
MIARMTEMRVLFVGPLSGYTSYPVVCKGLVQALTSAGFDLDIADTTWDGSPDHTAPVLMDESRSIRFLERRDVVKLIREGVPYESEGDVCVAVNPSHHMMGIKEKGYKIAGMFVGDVDEIPGAWRALMKQQDVILTPSTWGKQVISKAGVDRPIIVCNHGVSTEFTKGGLLSRSVTDPFVFLHACSAVYYPERKGTPQALKAFSRLVQDRKDVSLRLILGAKTRPMRNMLNALDQEVIDRLQVNFQEGAREPSEVRSSYLACHAGLFPSRAEGMGMMPIEMRSCGIPVIQTMCTGHADHLDPSLDPREWGVTVIRSGEMVEAWGKFGRAPNVSAEDTYEAMVYCVDHYDRLLEAAQQKAESVQAGWSWEETTRPLIDWIRALPR